MAGSRNAPGTVLSGGLVPTPLGPIEIAMDADGRLVALRFVEGDYAAHPGARWSAVAGRSDEATARRVVDEIEAWFAGRRRSFDLSLAPPRSSFLADVRAAIIAIPYGETRTYASIAASLGRPSGARAVGRASALNPLPVVVPCHRLVGSDGGLHGYAGGLHLKRWLLAHEARVVAAGTPAAVGAGGAPGSGHASTRVLAEAGRRSFCR